MTEETAKKKTRRAARRAQQASGAATPSATNRPTKNKLKSREAADKSDSSSIRDERLRAREAAAAKRRKLRDRERAQAAAEGLDTSELVDDALARGAHATTRFVQRHFKWLQWVIILGLAGGFGMLIYDYRVELGNQKATQELMAGLEAQFGRVKDDSSLEAPATGFVDTRPEFDSNAKRLEAAAEGYRQAIEGESNDKRRVLAKMGLAGVLFDQGKYQDAEKSYQDVKDSALAAKDDPLKALAIEGHALSLEAQGKKAIAQKSFKELENMTGAFAELGKYHRARLLYEEGKREDAKKLLQKLLEKSEDEQDPFASPGFVKLASRQLLEAIDPGAAKPPPGGGMTPEQLKRIQEQLKKAAGIEGDDDTDMAELMKQLNSSLGQDAPAGSDSSPDPPSPKPEDPGTPAPQGATPEPAPEPPAPKAPAAPAPKAPAAPAPKAPAAPAPPVPPKAPTPKAPTPAAPAPAPAENP